MTNNDQPTFVKASGRPERYSIPNIQTARAIFKSQVDGNALSSARHSRIRRIKDGNPPYDEAKLKAVNLGYRHNINDRTMQAILDQKAGYFFELFQEVPNLADFRIVRGLPAEGADVQPRVRWEEIIGEEFSATLKGWPGFMPLMDFAGREADWADFGILGWPDPLDWRPTAIPTEAFSPEPYARVDIETWDLACYVDTIRVYRLIEIAENPDDAASEGWDFNAVRKLLVKVYRNGMAQAASTAGVGYASTQDFAAIQQGLRNNDSWVMNQWFDPIRVHRILTREPESGKISELLFPSELHADDTDVFLCERRDSYEKMSHALWILPANYGDGYIKSVRGVASVIEGHCDLSNRLFGQTLDAARLHSSLIVQPKEAGVDPRRINIVSTGLLTYIPNALAIQPGNTFNPGFDGLLKVHAMSEARMRNNAGVWRQHNEAMTENQPAMTAREVAERSTKEARLEKSNVAFVYIQLELLYREIFRRLTNPKLRQDKNNPGNASAVDFYRRCKERGVPVKFLNPKNLELLIVQAIGMGSWGVRLDVTSQLMQMRGHFDEAGQVNAVRDRVAALAGQRNVDRYKSAVSRDKLHSNESSMAALENAVMQNGSQIPAGSDQMQVLHFRSVSEFLAGIMKTVSEMQAQGGNVQNPGSYRVALEAGMRHAMEHLQYLSQDEAQQALVEEGTKFLRAVGAMIDFLTRAEEVQAKMAAQKRADDEAVVKEAESLVMDRKARMLEMEKQMRLQMEVDKNSSIVGERRRKSEESSEIQRRKADQDYALKANKQDRELALEEAATLEKLRIERLREQGRRG